ncbi:FAD-dependent oxidoreductase [Streptomyces mutabilis]|uniref:FAD-dependent oxidoreductase n=1 Tax=Streptomyces TaxID=1883 RepID=UPI000BC8F24F|nr:MULTISPECIES: FAD-dependent oxidoreductase [unclassified Streptomyces]MDN3245139.1 FAD-dependent oxidoreductase [Streptomyces sp. ZSW22]MDN3253207.1 FAD-dependent oxidoreductase [Streptomyces sp. MA25(2023)]MDQ0389187.1 2-polyprenyl-6-methoxyphenol hydroxylase-like FAD-dependent oxidoreductase [Streptomyces sp. DSM 42143]PAK23744.1 2-polyprenyl-6-methoxyphenol hydroxylase [Streptomyces sp. alain-838]
MTQPRTVLVVGGGAAGNAVTILLRRAGIAVDLIEAKDDWNATAGSGITLQGNALRVLRELGVWEQVEASGFGFGSVGITAPDGTVLHAQDDLRTGGEDLPATVGMQRPRLQRILIEAVRASGATVRLGTTAEILDQDADGVSVRLSDGTEARYDLIVAADGLGSTTRAAIGITDKPEPTGMAIWRIAAPRPAGVVRTDLAYGGPAYIAGYCPTSETTLYAYVVEANRDRASIPPESYAEEMRRLSSAYGGHWPEITEHITDPAKVNYTWFDRMLVEGSWHRGRVVLIGDAAHCCPPTLAQGAALSLEDAWVLAQMLTGTDEWDDALFQAYYERRIARVRPVVEASVQIGQWQLDGVRDADVPGLMARTMTMLRELP